ncbi:uncharacterized protein IL334_004387 [Kwoniella shivajii]|uniref:IMD domain-containing protein n=1 Tax=Kwoniella shivajii TaxID=564305 RepID=A0ABZ1D372_9TREE|nr:hypothetical protein IL334_004387 [Kwoniella shivajii]
MLTFKSLSPSRTSLPILQPSGAMSAPTSPYPFSGGVSLSSDSISYFPPNPTARGQGKKTSKEEALRNVKALEEVLSAWNEYRLATSALGRSGRKLAGALKDFAAKGGDKADIPSQTIRPTAALIDTIADLTLKLSRRIDKEYDEINSESSKYFTLLAKESRTHDAYMSAVGKRHDKADKAYRKATNSLSDTSNAHAGLLALKETLSEDINRANEDHHSLIGSKQSLLLFKIASSSGILAQDILSYFSDGLRKAAGVYPDIQYFRILAEGKWQSSLLPSLEDEMAENKIRENIRGMEARVALGEVEIIGKDIWDGINLPVQSDSAVTVVGSDDIDMVPVAKGDPKAKAQEAYCTNFPQLTTRNGVSGHRVISSGKETKDGYSTKLQLSSPKGSAHDDREIATKGLASPPIPYHSRPSPPADPSAAHRIHTTDSTASTTSGHTPDANGTRPAPSQLLSPFSIRSEHVRGTRFDEMAPRIQRPLSNHNGASPGAQEVKELSMPVDPNQHIGAGPIPIQSHDRRRPVSSFLYSTQCDRIYPGPVDSRNDGRPGELSNNSEDVSLLARQRHQRHSDFIEGCQLCRIDHEKL